ncbi:uncharacterized protein EV420DRAFT_714383 [Desarmillaria tabescens]|uniref:T6SS Phospholipase effector Tle1-like catalytic domain-containing protein n=1 Tax=Armillaria tabescens TaxID=1929756 RepID=A0AA39K363_ARMTA|nr:uncharacterized protein EV420DRAFT_714383 [Desarmillaria tabescens]KAK0451378.1 hypothetical protein EV420DRAFT_714383 [Desarmillaria tabescens]
MSNATASSHDPSSRTKRDTKCKCQCNPQCICNCPCLVHCVCRWKRDHKCKTPECKPHVCDSRCISHTSRNLVVCLDGTTNQFGHWNTNVIELYNRILKESEDANQLTFYSSGIGTYIPSTTHWLSTWFYNTIDSAIARSFMVIIEKAYRWLAHNYRDGDRIFLFGFSRGAYQVRAVAGMIQKLGLVLSGNVGLIPFAYELYTNRHKGKAIKDEADARALCENFKRTFSRNVKLHFVGVWDTVASVGLVQKSPLPLTTTAYHNCTFRHGLALDECRIKFLPTYLAGGWTPNLRLDYYSLDDKEMDVKEVWFVGSHSDVGGSNDPRTLSLGLVPLLWMENQAIDIGLRCRKRNFFGDWTWDNLHKSRPTISLRSFWHLLEVLPITRYQYTDPNATTRIPHFGKGRSIVPRQHIHVSVAFSRKNYKSKARFLGAKTIDLESIIKLGINSDPGKAGDLSWADEWKHVFEMDLFDDAFAQEMIERLDSSTVVNEQVSLLWRLSIMALSSRSAKKISSKIGIFVKMLKADRDTRIQAGSASCLFQLANHRFSQQIISEKDVLPELERMLKIHKEEKGYKELKIASLQCLLQLVLDSQVSNQQGTDCHSGPAVMILKDEQMNWPEFLYDCLGLGPGNHSIQPLAGLSCLMRLAKICLRFFFFSHLVPA